MCARSPRPKIKEPTIAYSTINWPNDISYEISPIYQNVSILSQNFSRHLTTFQLVFICLTLDAFDFNWPRLFE